MYLKINISQSKHEIKYELECSQFEQKQTIRLKS